MKKKYTTKIFFIKPILVIVEAMDNVCNAAQILKVVPISVSEVSKTTEDEQVAGVTEIILEKRLATSARRKISLRLDISCCFADVSIENK